jgi:hypothetical protein
MSRRLVNPSLGEIEDAAPDDVIVEERKYSGGFIDSVGGHPPGLIEYRSALRALPPLPPNRTAADYRHRFEMLMARMRETDELGL